jgi:hypothetical protein
MRTLRSEISYIWCGMSLAPAPRMPEDHVPAPAAADKSVITVDDVQSLLAELNIDSLMASLDSADSAPQELPKRESRAAAPADVPPISAITEERRSTRRLQLGEISGELRLTIPGCSDIQIINISGTGVLVETCRQLRPDTLTDLFVRLNGKRHALKGRAVRSTVHAVKPGAGIVYRTALHFDKPLPLEAH